MQEREHQGRYPLANSVLIGCPFPSSVAKNGRFSMSNAVRGEMPIAVKIVACRSRIVIGSLRGQLAAAPARRFLRTGNRARTAAEEQHLGDPVKCRGCRP